MDLNLLRQQLKLLSDLLMIPLSLYSGENCTCTYAPYAVSFEIAAPWREALSGSSENPRFLLTDEMLLFGEIDIEKGQVICVGPTRYGKVSQERVQQIISRESQTLQNADLRELMLYLGACESCSPERFSEILSFLYTMVHGKTAVLPGDASVEMTHQDFHRSGEFQAYDDSGSVDYENRILFYVAHGMVEPLRRMKTYTGDMPELASIPLRTYQNALIILNSLCQRAAISGGLEPEISHRIGVTYVRRIENCRTVAELVRLNADMQIAAEYSQRVAEIVAPSTQDPNIQKVVRYIRRNFQKKLTAKEIAAYVHLSKEYLSARFHKEIGMTLPTYIAGQKVVAAKELLAFTNMPMIDIATFLSFSSQSYFQSVFKKHAGVTPQEYRRQTRNRSTL